MFELGLIVSVIVSQASSASQAAATLNELKIRQ